MALSIVLDNKEYIVTETDNKLVYKLEYNGKPRQLICLPNVMMFADDTSIVNAIKFAVEDFHNNFKGE